MDKSNGASPYNQNKGLYDETPGPAIYDPAMFEPVFTDSTPNTLQPVEMPFTTYARRPPTSRSFISISPLYLGHPSVSCSKCPRTFPCQYHRRLRPTPSNLQPPSTTRTCGIACVSREYDTAHSANWLRIDILVQHAIRAPQSGSAVTSHSPFRP